MDATTRASALFIAVGVLVVGLVWLRDILTPFALAVFLWLIMDGIANALHRRIPFLPKAVALVFSISLVVSGAVAVVVVIADSAAEFAARGPDYVKRLDDVTGQIYALFGIEEPPGFLDALRSSDVVADAVPQFFQGIAGGLRSFASSALFVFIYVAFLFAAQASFPPKMKALFPDDEARARAARVIGGMRQSMERYLWVQSFVSVLTAVLSYVTLRLLGLDNALFWAFLIFLLNYIPTIGSIVATILPTLFALVQFDTFWQPVAVLLGVGAWQFLIGNFLQPRMQGENLNLATIVVLLGLAIWGAIWGLPGMFLSSPLTVMVMIGLAQFASTRWIAVLLSADGRPEVSLAPDMPSAASD